MSSAVPIEAIRDLARLSWHTAPFLCAPETGCADYHRVWTTIRWLLHNGAEPHGAAVFNRFAKCLGQKEEPRILISGGADAGLLALTHRCLATEDIKAHFVFTDHCSTPCAQVLAYGTSHALELEIHRLDMTSLTCEPVDGIVAHNFLLFFDDAGRRAVLENWARALVQGGLVALVQSLNLEENATRLVHRESPKDLDQLCSRLCARAAEFQMVPDEVAALEAAARRFWSTQFVSETPLPTLSILSAELADVGLELVEKLDLSDSGKPSGPLDVRRKKSTVKMGLLVRKT